MFGKFLKLFRGREKSELVEAEENFDNYMAEVDEAIADLIKPDRHLQDEYGEMHGKVDNIRKRVDEVVGGKAA